LEYEIVTPGFGAGNMLMYLDDQALQEPTLSVSIADMESDETWVFSPATGGGFNTTAKYLSEGLQSIYLKVPRNSITRQLVPSR
jgi:hypothetical protein